MKIIEPGKPTLDALSIFLQHELHLAQAGIMSLRDLASMDVEKINRNIGIDSVTLKTLKEMASRELGLEEAAKKYEIQKLTKREER